MIRIKLNVVTRSVAVDHGCDRGDYTIRASAFSDHDTVELGTIFVNGGDHRVATAHATTGKSNSAVHHIFSSNRGGEAVVTGVKIAVGIKYFGVKLNFGWR